MSIGAVDVALYDLDQTVETMDAFATDPARFLAKYHFTPDERAAFEAWDYGALYRMGAHPFLLFQAVRSLATQQGETIPDILKAYRTAVEPHGSPDFIT